MQISPEASSLEDPHDKTNETRLEEPKSPILTFPQQQSAATPKQEVLSAMVGEAELETWKRKGEIFSLTSPLPSPSPMGLLGSYQLFSWQCLQRQRGPVGCYWRGQYPVEIAHTRVHPLPPPICLPPSPIPHSPVRLSLIRIAQDCASLSHSSLERHAFPEHHL